MRSSTTSPRTACDRKRSANRGGCSRLCLRPCSLKSKTPNIRFHSMPLKYFAYLTLLLLLASPVLAADGIKVSAEKEKELLAILQSDAPKADKALACKKLALDGSAA